MKRRRGRRRTELDRKMDSKRNGMWFAVSAG
jgi:hypothetical protein